MADLGFAGPQPGNAAPSGLAQLFGALGAGMQGYMQGRQFRDTEQLQQQEGASHLLDVYRSIYQGHPEALQQPGVATAISGKLSALGLSPDQITAAVTQYTPEQQLTRRKAGIDLQPPPQIANLIASAYTQNPDQQSNSYRAIAGWYAGQGADDQAAKYETLAKDSGNEYIKRQAEAQRFTYDFQKLAETARHNGKMEGHWTRQDDARLKAIQAAIQGRIITGEYSVERANIMAQAAIEGRTITGEYGLEGRAVTGEYSLDRTNLQGQFRLAGQQRTQVMKEYDIGHRSWEKAQNQAAIAIRMGKALPPGWSKDQDGNPVGPPEPMGPDDFEAGLQNAIDRIKGGKSTVAQESKMIGQAQSLSPSQKRLGLRALKDPAILGGSDVNVPFPAYPYP